MNNYRLTSQNIVDELAQFIRQVDGNNKMGAGSLAEKICERFHVADPAVQGEPMIITDAGILAIAGRIESCPVSPWWLKDDVVIGDVQAAVLRFARALLVAAPQPGIAKTQTQEDRS